MDLFFQNLNNFRVKFEFYTLLYDDSKAPNKRTIPDLKMAFWSWGLFEDILRPIWAHLCQFKVI